MIECLNKTKEFRAKVLSEFGKTLLEPIDESSNIYNVEYEHPDDMIKYNPTCMVLDAKLRILTNKDSPFDTNKIGRLFPTRKLFGKKFMSVPRSCVIVSSAGSLYESGLGKFIGKRLIFFFVLRFHDESDLHFTNDSFAVTLSLNYIHIIRFAYSFWLRFFFSSWFLRGQKSL